MNGLDLFSGIGGISQALKPWVRTVAYCESDRYAQAVLLSRMRSGDIDRAPIWDDVQTLSGELLENVNIITGGFPCQDISVAGRGEGLGGKRSGLFFQIVRLTEELKPGFVFLENVPAIRTRGLDVVVKEFTRIGYDCRWTVVSAAEVGAPHLRKRWFFLAHSNRIGVRDKSDGQSECQSKTILGNDGKDWIFTHTESKRRSEGGADPYLKGLEGRECGSVQECASQRITRAGSSPICNTTGEGLSDGYWWEFEPAVGRVVNGLPHRVDRIRCLGNSVVPQQAKEAFKRLIGLGDTHAI